MDEKFFWFAFVLSHDLSYLALVFTSWKPRTKPHPWATLPFFLTFISGITLLGYGWMTYRLFSKKYLDIHYFGFLGWGFLILHYAFDAIIWKKSFSEPVLKSEVVL